MAASASTASATVVHHRGLMPVMKHHLHNTTLHTAAAYPKITVMWPSVSQTNASLLGPEAMSPPSITASDLGPPPPRLKTLANFNEGGIEGAFPQARGTKRRSKGFDFSPYQQRHQEAAWTLTILARGDAIPAGAVPPRAAASQDHMGLGRAMSTNSIRRDPVASAAAASGPGPATMSPSIYQHQEQKYEEQQDHDQQPRKRLCVDRRRRDDAPAPAPGSRLVMEPGQFEGQGVGVLDAQQLPPAKLTRNLTAKDGPPKPSPTDVLHWKVEQKIKRHHKQEQVVAMKTRLEEEVGQLRTYQDAIDNAPFVMVVMSAVINDSRILYTNKMATDMMGYGSDMLGGSFLMLVHPEDRPHMSSVINNCIWKSQSHYRRERCRFWFVDMNGAESFKQMDVSIKIGTRGLVCGFWEVEV